MLLFKTHHPLIPNIFNCCTPEQAGRGIALCSATQTTRSKCVYDAHQAFNRRNARSSENETGPYIWGPPLARFLPPRDSSPSCPTITVRRHGRDMSTLLWRWTLERHTVSQVWVTRAGLIHSSRCGLVRPLRAWQPNSG
jgi:hypothetical protein